MRAAVEELSGAQPVTADRLLALHRSLLPDSPEHHGIRSTQNWVGGSSYHPLDADFVPPPPELVPDLVDTMIGKVPEGDEIVNVEDWRFTIAELTGNRIRRVRVERRSEDPESDTEEPNEQEATH